MAVILLAYRHLGHPERPLGCDLIFANVVEATARPGRRRAMEEIPLLCYKQVGARHCPAGGFALAPSAAVARFGFAREPKRTRDSRQYQALRLPHLRKSYRGCAATAAPGGAGQGFAGRRATNRPGAPAWSTHETVSRT